MLVSTWCAALRIKFRPTVWCFLKKNSVKLLHEGIAKKSSSNCSNDIKQSDHLTRFYPSYFILLTGSINQFQSSEFSRIFWPIRISFTFLFCLFAVVFCQKQSDLLKNSWTFRISSLEIFWWIRWVTGMPLGFQIWMGTHQ